MLYDNVIINNNVKLIFKMNLTLLLYY